MGRDKKRDDKFFNCSQDHEIEYVANLYQDKETVKKLINLDCTLGNIKYMTHIDLYKKIEKELGFSVPD